MAEKSVSFSLKPTYIETNGGSRKFQLEMENFVASPNKTICILDAPTGAGKTEGFKKLAGDKKIIIVVPTNLLADQIYERFSGENSSEKATLLIAKKINEKKEESRSKGRKSSTQKVIESMISFKKYIITNPTILLRLLLNLYNYKDSREDQITSFLLHDISLIVFDEFHVFSQEQMKITIAINILLQNRIKFIYSSATPREFLKEYLSEIFPEDSITEITVKKFHSDGPNRVLIQSPLDVNLQMNMRARDLIGFNPEIVKDGKWFFICNEITDIDKIVMSIRKAFPSKRICAISGYHDPDNVVRFPLKDEVDIVIASNVVEQGIDIPPDVYSFIIDTGRNLFNLVQRMGRVGRGSPSTHRIILCLDKIVASESKGIEDTGELFKYLSKPLVDSEDKKHFSQYSIGVVLGIIVSKLTKNLRDEIKKNIVSQYPSINLGLKHFEQIDELMNNDDWVNAKKIGYQRILHIKIWWNDYRRSMERFIPEILEIKGEDLASPVKEALAINYDYLWIKSRKEYTENNGQILIKGDRENKDFDFEVSVKGIPFDTERSIKYGDLLRDSRNKILRALEVELEEMPDEDVELMQFSVMLKKLVIHTANRERLVPVNDVSL